MIENQIDKLAGRYGGEIITGNAMFNLPANMAISSITVRSAGATVQALRSGSDHATVIPANEEPIFKSPALLLDPGEWPPLTGRDITSIQLTNTSDSIAIWYKPI